MNGNCVEGDDSDGESGSRGVGTDELGSSGADDLGAVGSDPACEGRKPSATADGCCPAGAGPTDPDCTAVCGNGRIERGETCDPISNCPTAAACASTNACLSATISGAAARCNARCEVTEVTTCVAADGCCPPGCTGDVDSDCSTSCGNGEVSGIETCEPGHAVQPCAETCDDGDPCTLDVKTGTPQQCNVTCTHMPILQPANGDACCPPGANQSNDADCQTRCGDGAITGTETCDPASTDGCPSEATCRSNGCMAATLTGDPAACTARCERREILEPVPGDGCCPSGANAGADSDCDTRCGDGVVSGAETCDPMSATMPCPTASTCASEGCMGAMLMNAGTCTASCDRAPITTPRAGDGCCPSSANAANDSDCETRCGDGVVTGNEICDPESPRPCPTASSCRSSGCMKATLRSAGTCFAVCEMSQITFPTSGDDCCPPGADAGNDRDCPTVCGDGVVTGLETCDPRSTTPCITSSQCAAREVNCTTTTYLGSSLSCSAVCLETPGFVNTCGGCGEGFGSTRAGDSCTAVFIGSGCTAEGTYQCDGTTALRCEPFTPNACEGM